MVTKSNLATLAVLCCLTTLHSLPVFATVGGVAGGGGNTVGDELFDDYAVKGSVVIPADEIAKLAAPYIEDLRKKVPGFADRLSQGIKGITWYKESKLLSQTGLCVNGSETGLTPPIEQTVRACQNKLEVRIEQAWYEDKMQADAKLVAGLVVHELLVFQRIRNAKITETGVMRISRDIRAMSMTAEQLQAELKQADFGTFETLPQAVNSSYREAVSNLDGFCLAAYHGSDEIFKESRVDFIKSVDQFSRLIQVLEGKAQANAKTKQAKLLRRLKLVKASDGDACAGRPTSLVEGERMGTPELN